MRITQQVRGVANPLGKHLLVEYVLPGERRLPFIYRNRLEVTRAILAIQLYLREHLSLPAATGDLIKQGILKEWPTDPFDGKPLRYSREKAIVWSVGPDGVDHGGVREERHGDLQFLNQFQPAAKRLPTPPVKAGDLVWSITSGE